jgi:hypothetical protein
MLFNNLFIANPRAGRNQGDFNIFETMFGMKTCLFLHNRDLTNWDANNLGVGQIKNREPDITSYINTEYMKTTFVSNPQVGEHNAEFMNMQAQAYIKDIAGEAKILH